MQQWTIHDRYGNTIYMSEERWRHALEKRPWLDDFLAHVLTTVQRGRRQQDPLNSHKYKYYWPCQPLIPEFNYMVVVVLFGEKMNAMAQLVANNYVVNVWAVFLYNQR